MLNILRNGKILLNDINNFLKTEAEIINDFKTRINNALKEIDEFQSQSDFNYTRIVNKISHVESIFFSSTGLPYLEENY